MRGEEVIIAKEKRDSFKGWGEECSSVSQGHRYFMAFTFLHDTGNAQNRIDIAGLHCRGGEGVNFPVPPMFLAHLCLEVKTFVQ